MHGDPTRGAASGAPWNVLTSHGPVLATAIHAGHHIRSELQPWLAADEEVRLREEDPMTDYLLTCAGHAVRANRSRFECDLNRTRERCISSDPEDTWGLTIWREDLPEEQMESSRRLHDAFYAQMKSLIGDLVVEHGRALVLDLHSFNHRREGPLGAPADPETNPDIDLGVTELNPTLYGALVERMTRTLRTGSIRGRSPDVRHNKRFPDGGAFPEWVHRTFGDDVCTITLEYKKFFMDEWDGRADILALQHARAGLLRAVEGAAADLGRVGP